MVQAARSPRRVGLSLAAVVLILGALLAASTLLRPKPAKAVRNPTVPVSVAAVVQEDAPVTLKELGSALPWRGVTVRAQVNGRLLNVDFTEGAAVRKGELLAEIDPAPYAAALMQAQGALRRDTALLEQARLDLKRYQSLAAENSIASQQVDAQAALVKQDEGTVLLDRGQVAAAQVNVDYCKIRSPVDGRVGVRLVDPGNIVSTTDTTGIVIVNEISPIAVTFNVPEADFHRLMTASDDFRRTLPVQAFSQETGEALGSGVLSIADNHVDPTTGTVELKARFENPDRRLWPSQFVNVRLTLQILKNALTAPAAAVNQGPHGAFVYVVTEGRRAEVRPVEVLASEEGRAVLRGGVRPGDKVVTDGQMSLKPGAQVAVVSAPSAGGRGL